MNKKDDVDVLALIEDRDRLKAKVLSQDRLLRDAEQAFDRVRIPDYRLPLTEWPLSRRIEGLLESVKSYKANSEFSAKQVTELREKLREAEKKIAEFNDTDEDKGALPLYHHLKASVLDFLGWKTGDDVPGVSKPFDKYTLQELKGGLSVAKSNEENMRKVSDSSLKSFKWMYETLKQAVMLHLALGGPEVKWTTEQLVDELKKVRLSDIKDHRDRLQKEKDGLVIHAQADQKKIEALEKEVKDLRTNPSNYLAGQVLELIAQVQKLNGEVARRL